MNETLLAVILAIITSSGIWSIVLAVVNHRLKKREVAENNDSRERQLLLAIARDRLYFLLSKILQEWQDGKRKGIKKDEWEVISQMFDAYQALGGNGVCLKLYEACDELPTAI